MSSMGVIRSSGCAAATRLSVRPRSECSFPITAIVSFQFRPTMSLFKSATMLESGTVGCSAKYSLPHSPFSSPLTVMKTRERLGRGVSREKASAASMTAVVPDASSSAPLQMESAPTARQAGLPGPATPMWSMCPVKNTYSCLSFGSLPSSTPMTFGADSRSSTRCRAGNVTVVSCDRRPGRGWCDPGPAHVRAGERFRGIGGPGEDHDGPRELAPGQRRERQQVHLRSRLERHRGPARDHESARGRVELLVEDAVPLQEAAAVPAGSQADALELAGDVRGHLLELGARRVATAHRVVGEDPDAAMNVAGHDGAHGALDGGRSLRGERARKQREPHVGKPTHATLSLSEGKGKTSASGLAAPQLRVATLGFVLGRVPLWQGAGLAPGRRWRGLRARRPLRGARLDLRATLRLAALAARRAHLGAHREGGPILTLRPIAAIRAVPPFSCVAAVRGARVVGPVGAVRPIGLAAMPVVVAGLAPTLTLVSRPARDVRTAARRGNDPDAPQVAPAYAALAPAIVVRGPLRHPRDEYVRAAAVLKDEARLGPVRPGEHHAGAAVITIGVVVRVVEHDDAEAHARVVVHRPQGIAHIGVAIVAQEPRIVVVAGGRKTRGVIIPSPGVGRGKSPPPAGPGARRSAPPPPPPASAPVPKSARPPAARPP